MTRPEYKTPLWKRVRKQVLARDGRRCQLQLPGCTQRATQVDHRVDIADGGAPYDPANCQAACAQCNLSKMNRARSARARAQREGTPMTPATTATPYASAVAKLSANPDMGTNELTPAERLAITGYDW